MKIKMKQIFEMNSKDCSNCLKQNVCMFKEDYEIAKKEIEQIKGETPVVFEINLICIEWIENKRVRLPGGGIN